MMDLEETVCGTCGESYALREGQDPTRYCDACAHQAVEDLLVEVKLVRLQRETAWIALGSYADMALAAERAMLSARAERDAWCTRSANLADRLRGLLAASALVVDQWARTGFSGSVAMQGLATLLEVK